MLVGLVSVLVVFFFLLRVRVLEAGLDTDKKTNVPGRLSGAHKTATVLTHCDTSTHNSPSRTTARMG